MSCVPGKPYSYGVKSGTSMSTPLVTGAIACALEKILHLPIRISKLC
ncbi:MAG: S8 family serine peptidase [Blautia faecis]